MAEALQVRAFTGIANDGTGGSVVNASTRRHRMPDGTLSKIADAFEAAYGLEWRNPNTGEVTTVTKSQNVSLRVLDLIFKTLDQYEFGSEVTTASATAAARIATRKQNSTIE